MAQKANITVYLQALGAHYLGAHAFMGSAITIDLVYSGGKISLPYLITPDFTTDGNPSSSFVAGASSFMPIITVPNGSQTETMVNYLSPDLTTVCGRANFQLEAQPEMAQLLINVPTPSSSTPLTFQQSIMLSPDQPVYTVTVPIPGLYLSPSTISESSLSVYVKMMCGCPVTMGPPASLWPASDYIVYANVLDASGGCSSYQLSYAINQPTNSLFQCSIDPPLTSAIKAVTFSAVQRSTGNSGVLQVEA